MWSFFPQRKAFPFQKQHDTMDCGPCCLRMIAKHYDKSFSLQHLRQLSGASREGVSLLSLSEAAERIGFRTRGVYITMEQLHEIPLPCIAHWSQNHFIVVHDIDERKVYVADPAADQPVAYTLEEFRREWAQVRESDDNMGIVLLLEPTPAFYDQESEESKGSFWFLLSYLRPYKSYLLQLGLGLLVGSLLQLVFPFLTQAIVDFGIRNRDLNFVYLILIAQLVLYFSEASVEFIRSWILLHVSSRVNIAFISDFLLKLTQLPISFFDTKSLSDLLRRIDDHQRVEIFLTSVSLSIIFSVVNLIVFSFVLLLYSFQIFAVFFVASSLTAWWILKFMQRRRDIDHKRFALITKNQNALIQMIHGMPEVKLNNCEKQKRWEWEQIQARLFKVGIKGLMIDQYQQAGSLAATNIKNILISFLAARLVIQGEMTLGMMMAVQYIVGQVNLPINQLLGFAQRAQDTKISLERMAEIHKEQPEEALLQGGSDITVPAEGDIILDNISFRYGGSHNPMVLKDFSLRLPRGKTTAVVGVSGSGKTTLLKLLLKFYKPLSGQISVGDTALEDISNRVWRAQCGVVMQDGYIFSDTFARNIALGDDLLDRTHLRESVRLANIEEMVNELPYRYNTEIGSDGVGISQGQKQRILIARALYKDPNFLFFDEATSSLDANNERNIIENLDKFCKGRTVLIIAHRLSTVCNADQIAVMEKGELVELGTHEELVKTRGKYFELVKNQLELGK